MFRVGISGILAAAVCFGTVGCSHFVETKAIEHFAASLEKKDLAGLKNGTTEDFEKKALRHAEAVEDLKLLRIPDKDVTVSKVEDVSPTEKKVTVVAGPLKKKVLFKLSLDKASGKWLVDDIYMRQKKGGVTASKSVTEQMDLLLTVREFIDAWDEGNRSKILANSAPDLKKNLEDLPPVYLARVSKQILGKKGKSSRFRPAAQLDEDVAVVKLARSSGSIILSLRLQDGTWKATDLAIESKIEEDQMPSLMRLVGVLNLSSQFLAAYTAGDRSRLQPLCETTMFRESLSHADLTLLKLPNPQDPESTYSVKVRESRAEFLVRHPKYWLQLNMVKKEGDNTMGRADRFVIEDASLHDLETKQERRLSSVFTSHAMMLVFLEALDKGDLTTITKCTTTDFNNRVWEKIRPEQMSELSLQTSGNWTPRTQSTRYNGAVTEIDVAFGGETKTFVLRERNGAVRVDDVLENRKNLPRSLKELLEITLPLHGFAEAISQSDLRAIQRSSSRDFNRLVWKQTETVPATAYAAARHLRGRPQSIQTIGDKVLVKVGNENEGAEVTLLKEGENLVVDEALLIAGPAADMQVNLKQSLRIQMATGGLQLPGSTPRPNEPEQFAEKSEPRLPDSSKRRSLQQAAFDAAPGDFDDEDLPRKGFQTNSRSEVRDAEFRQERFDSLPAGPAGNGAEKTAPTPRPALDLTDEPLLRREPRRLPADMLPTDENSGMRPAVETRPAPPATRIDESGFGQPIPTSTLETGPLPPRRPAAQLLD